MLYGVPVLGIAVIACLLRWYGAIGQRFSLILLFTLIFALQRLYSSILKSEDKGWLGVLFDGGYYFILTGVILVIWSFGITHHVMLLEAAMQVYLFVLGGFYVRQFYKLHTKSIPALLHDDCGEILRYSLHMVVSGIIIYWLTSSARIYIAYFMGYEQVGIYSFYFRLAGIAIIIHQFLYIAFFQKLYMGNSRRLDLYYTAIMGLVLCGCLACYLFVPLLSRYFLKGLSIDNARLFFLIALQMPLWVGISLCEGLVGRRESDSTDEFACHCTGHVVACGAILTSRPSDDRAFYIAQCGDFYDSFGHSALFAEQARHQTPQMFYFEFGFVCGIHCNLFYGMIL